MRESRKYVILCRTYSDVKQDEIHKGDGTDE